MFLEGGHQWQQTDRQTDDGAAGKRLQDVPSDRQLEKGRSGLGASQ